MAAIQATRLKKGMLVKIDQDLFRVLELQHVTPGNLRGFVQARMRNLRTGNSFEHRFGSTEKVERAAALLAICRQKLAATETKVKKVTADLTAAMEQSGADDEKETP